MKRYQCGLKRGQVKRYEDACVTSKGRVLKTHMMWTQPEVYLHLNENSFSDEKPDTCLALNKTIKAY